MAQLLERLGLRAKKVITVHDEARIEVARQKVTNALEVFAKASEEVTHANLELSTLIQKKRAELDHTNRILENAQVEMELNNKLKVRLDAFNPKA